MSSPMENESPDLATGTADIAPASTKASVTDHLEVIDGNVVEQIHLDGTADWVDKQALGGDADEMPAGYWHSADFIGTVLAVCLGAMLGCLSFVVPANTLSLINDDIGPSPNINWVATSWTLSNSVGYLLFGRLSDIFGRRWLTIAANLICLVGCIVAATANHVNALIAACALNGVAAAVQLSFPILLGELVSNRHRGPITAIVFLSCTPFNTFGPAIARLFFLNTAAQWRWSFYLGIILASFAVALFFIFYHPPRYGQLHVHGKSKWQQVKQLDHGGFLLFLGGVILFLIGLSWGGQVYPWKSARVICMVVIGGLVLIVFGFYEQYVVQGHGIMPPRIFRNRQFVVITITSTLGAMVYFSMTVLWPILIGSIYTTNIVKIGWQSCVVGGGTLLGQAIGGFGLTYIPKVKWQAILSSAGVAAFFASLASLDVDTHAQIIVLGIFATVSVGWIDNIGYAGVSLLFEAQDIGLACGLLGTIRSLGGAVAQALYISIFQNKLKDYLPEYVAPAAVQAGLPQSSLPALFGGISSGNFTAVPGITPEIAGVVAQQVKYAYISSFRTVFYATIPFGFFLFVFSFFVPNFDSLLSQNVAKKLQRGKKPQSARRCKHSA